jgi:hypothetical protein
VLYFAVRGCAYERDLPGFVDDGAARGGTQRA